MSRTANDWGNLVLAELKGRESPGTVARLLGEITGHKPVAPTPTKDETADFKRAGEIVRHIGTDKALQARLATLQAKAEEVQRLTSELERREKVFEQYRAVEHAKLDKAKSIHTENLAQERDAARQEIEARKADWKSKLKDFLDLSGASA
jgi:hypothetical protein